MEGGVGHLDPPYTPRVSGWREGLFFFPLFYWMRVKLLARLLVADTKLKNKIKKWASPKKASSVSNRWGPDMKEMMGPEK